MVVSAACIVMAALASTYLVKSCWAHCMDRRVLALRARIRDGRRRIVRTLVRDLSATSITLVSLLAFVPVGVALLRLRRARSSVSASPPGTRRLAPRLGEVIGWWPALLATVLVVATLIWRTLIALRLGVLDYDGFLYHLVTADVWLQANALVDVPQNRWAAGYPHNGELLVTWLMAIVHSDALAALASVISVPLLTLGVAGLSRYLGASRLVAVFAAALVSLMPVVQWTTGTSHVDSLAVGELAMAWWFGLLVLNGRRDFGTLAVFGIAAGLAMGTKAPARSSSLRWVLASPSWCCDRETRSRILVARPFCAQP